MEQEAHQTGGQLGFSNIEAAFELLIQNKPHKVLEIRRYICLAWQHGFLTDSACQRLYHKLTLAQNR